MRIDEEGQKQKKLPGQNRGGGGSSWMKEARKRPRKRVGAESDE
jgi:hypothetical protein